MRLPNSSKSMFVLRLLTIFRRNHRFPQIYLTWLTVSEKPCDNGVQTVVHISVVFEGFTLNNSIGPKKDPPRRATPQPLTPWPQPKSHQGVHFPFLLIPSDPASHSHSCGSSCLSFREVPFPLYILYDVSQEPPSFLFPRVYKYSGTQGRHGNSFLTK